MSTVHVQLAHAHFMRRVRLDRADAFMCRLLLGQPYAESPLPQAPLTKKCPVLPLAAVSYIHDVTKGGMLT